MNKPTGRRRAVSLVEVIVAVVIIGLLAALAIPRFSEATTGDVEEELRTSLQILRSAIDLFHEEHGFYPGQQSADRSGEVGTQALVVGQLTQFTDARGRVSRARSTVFHHGPYLRDGIPICPLASPEPSNSLSLIAGAATPAHDDSLAGAGWVYNYQTGYIAANVPGEDSRGQRYDRY